MICRGNVKVGKVDLVYVLVDMIWKMCSDGTPNLIKSLNGQIILIRENMIAFYIMRK